MGDKSRIAARIRRNKENQQLLEMTKLLPLPSEVSGQLDKASVIRLALSYLKMRHLFPYYLYNNEWESGAWRDSKVPDSTTDCQFELSSLFLKSLDGFLFVVAPDGKIMYISETVSTHLGLSQIELTGNSIFEYIHEHDCQEMHELLSPTPLQLQQETQLCFNSITETLEMDMERAFFLRVKCSLPKKSAGITFGSFKVVHCSGYLKVRQCKAYIANISMDSRAGFDDEYCKPQSFCLVAVGQLLPTAPLVHYTGRNSLTDIQLSLSCMFMFRACLALKFISFDASASSLQLLGYEPADLIDKTFYHYVHISDVLQLSHAHRTLLIKGQVTTKYYRFLCKSGGWAWIQSYASVVSHGNSSRNYASTKNCNSDIVAVNYVLSKPENPNVVLSLAQQDAATGSSQQQPQLGNDGRVDSPLLNRHQQRKRRKFNLESIVNTHDIANTSSATILPQQYYSMVEILQKNDSQQTPCCNASALSSPGFEDDVMTGTTSSPNHFDQTTFLPSFRSFFLSALSNDFEHEQVK